MFSSTTLWLLLANCAASAQSDPAGPACTTVAEESIAVDPAVSANLNLLQVGLALKNLDSAPEGGLTEYNKVGPKAMTILKDEVLGLLSEDMQDLDRLLPSEESLQSAASLLIAEESVLTAALPEQILVSNSTAEEEAAHARAVGGPQDSMVYGVVGCVLLLACCPPLLGCLKLYSAAEASDFLPAPPVLDEVGSAVRRRRSLSTEDGTRSPSFNREVWWNFRKKMTMLFLEMAEVQQSDETPLGYLTSTDITKAMADPRMKEKMLRLGLTENDWEIVFMLLDPNSNSPVDTRKFFAGVMSRHGGHKKVDALPFPEADIDTKPFPAVVTDATSSFRPS